MSPSDMVYTEACTIFRRVLGQGSLKLAQADLASPFQSPWVPPPSPGGTPVRTPEAETGGLSNSTCNTIGTNLPQIHDYIPAALAKQDSSLSGAYQCTAAWTEVTDSLCAWVLCTIGGGVQAVFVCPNNGNHRLPYDPNAAVVPEMPGAESNPLLDKYRIIEAKAVASFDDTIPARVKAAAGAAPVVAKENGHQELRLGNIPPTAQELATTRPLPELTTQQLASVPSAWDVRNQGFDCLAFKRSDQGTCGSCWGMLLPHQSLSYNFKLIIASGATAASTAIFFIPTFSDSKCFTDCAVCSLGRSSSVLSPTVLVNERKGQYCDVRGVTLGLYQSCTFHLQ